MADVTHTPLTLSYFIRDISLVLQTYNRLRWFRGRTETGAFEQITTTTPGPAVMRLSGASLYQVVGLPFRFTVGISEVEVIFTGVGALTPAQVVTQIEAATGLVEAEVDGDDVVVTSATLSTVASLLVGDGEANAFFGVSEGDGFLGLDADSVLVPDVHEYFLTDSNSDTEFWYRVQFWHSTTLERSPRTIAFPANQAQRVPYVDTIVAFVKLASLTGEPICGREVVLYNTAMPNLAGSDPRWGVFRQYEKLTTDKNGYAEIRILRGITVEMSVVGTGFVRRIGIPLEGSQVNLLDPELVLEDEFGIQEPSIDFALRLS